MWETLLDDNRAEIHLQSRTTVVVKCGFCFYHLWSTLKDASFDAVWSPSSRKRAQLGETISALTSKLMQISIRWDRRGLMRGLSIPNPSSRGSFWLHTGSCPALSIEVLVGHSLAEGWLQNQQAQLTRRVSNGDQIQQQWAEYKALGTGGAMEADGAKLMNCVI